MRVAIVGGPGVGKSTLVRQLADLYHNGSYGEGEKGVWHPRVLEDIAAGRNPIGVTEYFARLYDANYRDAAAHDARRPGDLLRGRAHDARGPHRRISGRLSRRAAPRSPAMGEAWRPDRIIVLTSSRATIERQIIMRNRSHEGVENMVRRFQLIDDEFRRLAPLDPTAVVIDRDGREFHERFDLLEIIRMAGLPMFNEIPYDAALSLPHPAATSSRPRSPARRRARGPGSASHSWCIPPASPRSSTTSSTVLPAFFASCTNFTNSAMNSDWVFMSAGVVVVGLWPLMIVSTFGTAAALPASPGTQCRCRRCSCP